MRGICQSSTLLTAVGGAARATPLTGHRTDQNTRSSDQLLRTLVEPPFNIFSQCLDRWNLIPGDVIVQIFPAKAQACPLAIPKS